MQSKQHTQPSNALILVRHGATEPNLTGLRCGGDLDVPLVELGRRQAVEAGLRIRALGIPVGVIVTSHLKRARETAEIIGELLPGVEVVVDPAFAERRLGSWNMRPVAETEAGLAQHMTPQGGEANAEFLDRIAGAVEAWLPRLHQRPLLVGSKGVARALGELIGMPSGSGIANGELVHFDLSVLTRRGAVECVA